MSDVDLDLVLREDENTTAILTINKPDSLNSLSAAVQDALEARLDEVEADDAINTIVITGAGEKAFVAGADIGELAKRSPIEALGARLQRLFERLATFPKPTIAAVNGFSLGGGLELALACDVRVASTTAKFGFPETGLGLLPSAGGTQRLPELVGVGLALDLIITGRKIDADEARTAQLVTYVVEPEELRSQALKVAERIERKGPLAVRLAREAVKRGFSLDHDTGFALERIAQTVLFHSPEKEEGTRAFGEKRHPDYSEHRGDRP